MKKAKNRQKYTGEGISEEDSIQLKNGRRFSKNAVIGFRGVEIDAAGDEVRRMCLSWE